MAKRAPSNSMPWPQNLIYDFHLPPATSPEIAEAFITTLPTSDKNKEFLRLRYRDGQSYKDIAPAYGISAGGVRQAVKYVIGKYNSSADATVSADASPDDASVDTESSVERPSTDDESSVESSPATDAESGVAPQKKEKKVREELKPIITAIANTTRQRSFVYDSKTRVVTPTEQVPRGLRRDSRYIPLPDYHQIKEYDLMQEFASTLADPEKSRVLEVALGGLGPFKAFRSTVRDIGLGQAWADFRYGRFIDLAEEWWGREVAATSTLVEAMSSNTSSNVDTRAAAAGKSATEGVLIVDPATLNGIALIETIRILYRRVGPAYFEEALDELRDAVCSAAGEA